MCLTISKNNLKSITAEQDIVCYKVLKKLPNRDILNAPIYKFEYCFGIIYFTPEDYFSYVDVCDDGCSLANYGFHSFVELSDAVRYKERLMETTQNYFDMAWDVVYDFVVVKCTIPNGSRYYQGKQVFALHEEHSPDGYCSEAIRINEIVNENEN